MRSALRDAELPPPAGGWERLQRELGAAASKPAVPAPRKPAWRIHMPRIAAAAAVAALFFAAGGYLFRPDEVLKQGGTDIASAAGPAAAEMPQRAEPESVQELLAQQVGLPRERTARTSSSIRRQTLLAAAQPGTGKTGHAAEERAAALREPDITASSARTRDAAEPFAEDNPAAAWTAGKHSAAEQPAGKQGGTEQAGGNDAAAPERAREASRTSSAPAGRAAQRSTTRSAGAVSARTAYPDEPFVAYTPPRKTASFSLFAGGGVTGGKDGLQGGPMRYSDVSSDLSAIVGNGDNMSLLQRSDEYGESSFRHHQALSFGLAVRKEFAHGLSLESGVNYTLLRSDVREKYAPEDVSQKLHFIGVPLRLNWQFFERGRFSLYIGAGGQVEKCVSAKFGSKSMDEPGVQWSALAAAGAQYRIGTTVGLYFEPEGSYYFTKTALRTARTDSPLTLTLRLGVRLSF